MLSKRVNQLCHFISFHVSVFSTLATSQMTDLSSPNHGLDSPMSGDYSTASTDVLDTNSLSGDGLTSNYKSNF